MNKEIKNKIIATIISILIIAGIIFFGYKIIMGRDGLLRKVSSVESEYDKTEVLEKLSTLIKEKYMASYKESNESSDKKIEDVYNANIAISYLAESKIIGYYYYSNFNENTKEYTYLVNEENIQDMQKRDDCFWIDVDSIAEVQTFGKGKKYDTNNELNKNDVFLIEKKQDGNKINYVLNYYDSNGRCEEIGVLKIEDPL